MKYTYLIILMLFSSVSFSQTVTKHPRVAELERFLSSEAFSYVKGRFPDAPVLVEVQIDPLRRVQTNSFSTTDDVIPFNTSTKIEVVDEWDDSSRTMHELFSRIRTATVKIILPSKITDKEVLELRESLFSNLKLIYGRDKIEFERRIWKTERKIDWYDILMIAIVLALFMPVLYFSLRSAASKVSKSLAEVGTTMGNANNNGGGISAAPAPISTPASRNKSPSGNIRFNDPIQIAEKIKPVIDKLAEDATFPDLEDMIMFDQSVCDNSTQAGALLNAMPKHMQEKLFMLSKDNEWLAAFSEPGEISTSNYEFVNRLQSKDRTSENHEWQEMLIILWRLGDLLPNFLQEIKSEEAMAILASMPSMISIPIGKRALPGSWAALLDPDFKKEPLNPSQIGQLTQKALEIRPYNDVSMLKKYRHEKGLISYLKTATIRDEREVYEAAGSNSTIHVLRPPFFQVLNMPEEEMLNFIPKFGMEQWALALFNVSRDDRVSFEKAISDKQRYFFIENMKALNSENIEPDQIGEARERIAAVYSTIRSEKIISDVVSDEANDAKTDQATDNKAA